MLELLRVASGARGGARGGDQDVVHAKAPIVAVADGAGADSGDVGPGASAGGANPAAFLLFVVGLAVLALRRFRTAEV